MEELEVRASRSLLAAASDYFNSVLGTAFKEEGDAPIEIRGVSKGVCSRCASASSTAVSQRESASQTP